MTPTSPYADDLAFACRLADAARRTVAPYFRAGVDIENKLSEGFDPVTAADRACEAAMRALIEAERPQDGVRGEEFGETASQNGRSWVLDPIDGTRAFIAGLPTWTVLIALYEAGRPVLGVIDQPHMRERFTGAAAGASYTGPDGASRAIRARAAGGLDAAILASTDHLLFEGAEATAFEALRRQTRLTRFGYDAYAYAMLAMGGIDLVVESGLAPHDVGALIPVVEGAGGVLTNWKGEPAWEGGQVIAAAHPELHAAALDLLAPAAG